MAGDKETAVQIMQMEKELDTGDILLSETASIDPRDNSASLSERLSRIGAGLWPRALAALERGGLRPTPQIGEPVYAHKIDKAEARIDWTRPAHQLDGHIRGLAPFPGSWSELDGKRIKIHLAQPQQGEGLPGTVIDDELLIACGHEALRILELQPAGKAKMAAKDFLRGAGPVKGKIFT